MGLSSQYLTIEAKNNGGLEIMLSFLYGDNWISQREFLWSDLQQIHQSSGHKPWALLDDFNTARYTDEKVGGKQLSFANYIHSIDSLIIDH